MKRLEDFGRCEFCYKELTTRYQKRFCTVSCSKKWKSIGKCSHIKQCLQCGKNMNSIGPNFKEKFYCSNKCSRLGRKNRPQMRKAAIRIKKEIPTKKCILCKKIFEKSTTISQKAFTQARFCSRSCYYTSMEVFWRLIENNPELCDKIFL